MEIHFSLYRFTGQAEVPKENSTQQAPQSNHHNVDPELEENNTKGSNEAL